MEKKYKIKSPSKEVLKKYWVALKSAEDYFCSKVQGIEEAMAIETGIGDIEFIKDEMLGGEWIGIGNISRTMPLFQREDLE